MTRARRATREVVVLGGGGHAKVLVSVLKKCGYKILGYTDKEDRGLLLGVQYLGADDVLRDMNGPGTQAIVGVGKIDASSFRLRLQDSFTALGFGFPSVCSPNAIVNEDVLLDAGTVVFDGAVITSGTRVGRATIINTSSTVEHDCRIGNNVHVAPGATLSGGVTMGDNCLLGAGATVIQSLHICADCVIGAGSVVLDHIEVPGTYAGNPARLIRKG